MTLENVLWCSIASLLLAIGGCRAPACEEPGGCGNGSGETATESDGGDGDGDGDPTSGDGDGEPTTGDGDGDGTPDMGEPPACEECGKVDLLLVIDNSGTMGEEQVNLAANFPLLIDQLKSVTDGEGNPAELDVNIMVTTTDLGHPSCTPFQPDGYEPKQGAPQDVACIDRLEDFTGLGSNAPEFPQACELSCPMAIEPTDPFIHFEGPDASITNVPGDDVKGALGCLGPQGINGCGYEAPLEAMLRTIDPEAAWNSGSKPFLRDGAILAVVIVTDETDCSVRAPDGYAYFTDEAQNDFWEINPDTGTKTQATSAVCWNAGVNCGMPDANGVYADCHSIETEVLFPMSRYLDYLQGELVGAQEKAVVMLGILGVPSGGVEELVYRTWRDGLYPVGDILPGDDSTAAEKEFEFGIGPGCTGEDGMGGFTGQAIPSVRVQELCQALDVDVGGPTERIHCCLESVCDSDFSGAFACLTGVIQTVVAEQTGG